MTPSRDLLGYGGSQPDPGWPGGARVAVSFVVNFEEGAEYSIADGDGENEAVYEIEQRLVGQPDPAIDTHFEYGSRAGWWRIGVDAAENLGFYALGSKNFGLVEFSGDSPLEQGGFEPPVPLWEELPLEAAARASLPASSTPRGTGGSNPASSRTESVSALNFKAERDKAPDASCRLSWWMTLSETKLADGQLTRGRHARREFRLMAAVSASGGEPSAWRSPWTEHRHGTRLRTRQLVKRSRAGRQMPHEGQKLQRRKLPGDLQGRPGLRQASPKKPPNLSVNGSAMPMRMLEAALAGLDA